MSFAMNVKLALLDLSTKGVRVPNKAYEMVYDEKVLSRYSNLSAKECAKVLVNVSQLF